MGLTVFDLKAMYLSTLRKTRELDRVCGGCREAKFLKKFGSFVDLLKKVKGIS